jgi:hypothetical protein
MLFFIDEKEYFALVQERRTKLLLVPQHKYEHYNYGQHYKKSDLTAQTSLVCIFVPMVIA